MRRWAEVAVALALSALVVVLSLRLSTHAGPLWRDEVHTVNLANEPTYADFLGRLHLDSTPALYPTVVRAWSALGWRDEDAALRVLGFLVAAGAVPVLWLAARVLGLPVPLVSLALLGAHPTVLRALGSVRPYGLGAVFVVLAFAAIGRLTSSPRLGVFVLAAVASILAVQTLYQNAVLILAMCVAGAAASAAARDWKAGSRVLAAGMAAALSLLPYTNVVIRSQDWRPLNYADFGTGWVLEELAVTLSGSSTMLLAIWVLAFGGALYGAVRLLRASPPGPRAPAESRRTPYALLTLVCATAAQVTLHKLSGRIPQPWHFVPLMAVMALCLETLLLRTTRFPWARLAVAAAAVAAVIAASIAQVGVRQTNVDLIVRHLERSARAGDLIVVNPWYVGITFARYYRGEVPWLTLPPIEDHTIHRFDLVKQRMLSPDPLAPLYVAIGEALRSGHRVWLVGSLHFVPPGQGPAALPRPGGTTGWSDDVYGPAWSMHAGYFVHTHALRWEIVTIAAEQPVNLFERPPLVMVEGWAPRS
jgi:hypothetical protein